MTDATRPATAAWRVLLAPTVATAVALAILIALGLWQLERKAWKEALLSAVDARAFGAPVSAPAETAWPDWSPARDEFRRVELRGTFLHDREIQLHGLAEERRGQALQGFYVFTPLRRSDGSLVMVNRGFVPTALRAPATRGAGRPDGAVEVVGLLRNPEVRGAFVPPNDAAKDDWFVRSLAEMAAIGDMSNDLAMLEIAGFSIAMGNAPDAVRAKVDAVTASNREDGFAKAMRTLVLPRAAKDIR